MQGKKAMHRDSFIVRHSFLVRILWEADQPEWKGWVQHIHSGESVPFRNPDQLLAFIEHHAGELTVTGRKGLK